jgi:hypothetical protein
MKCQLCARKTERPGLICHECWNKSFSITGVRRGDLEAVCSEEELARLDDGAMLRIAGKMADANGEQMVWIDAQTFVDAIREEL